MVGTLSEDIAAIASVERRIQPTYGYYRQKNGWITVSTITRLEKVNYIERGWTALDKYGAFDMTPYVANHPFEALFMFGGVHEMSAEQVLQTGLYMNPPLVPRCRQHITQFHRTHTKACWVGAQPVVFPQMAELPPERVGPFQCRFCPRELPTREGREQHQSVVHQEALSSLRTGQSVGESLAGVLGGMQKVPVTPPADDRVAELQGTVAKLEEQLKRLSRPKRRRGKASKEALVVST